MGQSPAAICQNPVEERLKPSKGEIKSGRGWTLMKKKKAGRTQDEREESSLS